MTIIATILQKGLPNKIKTKNIVGNIACHVTCYRSHNTLLQIMLTHHLTDPAQTDCVTDHANALVLLVLLHAVPWSNILLPVLLHAVPWSSPVTCCTMVVLLHAVHVPWSSPVTCCTMVKHCLTSPVTCCTMVQSCYMLYHGQVMTSV